MTEASPIKPPLNKTVAWMRNAAVLIAMTLILICGYQACGPETVTPPPPIAEEPPPPAPPVAPVKVVEPVPVVVATPAPVAVATPAPVAEPPPPIVPVVVLAPAPAPLPPVAAAPPVPQRSLPTPPQEFAMIPTVPAQFPAGPPPDVQGGAPGSAAPPIQFDDSIDDVLNPCQAARCSTAQPLGTGLVGVVSSPRSFP
jgi:hypothetical protein